ncbi:MAG: hypothetical protein FK730_14540, partial [Asgard group archaeon]|nr:hypothetical protein [Asgard group archaeon]
MFEEVLHFYTINNPDFPTGLFILYALTQLFFMLSSALFLGLFIWSIVLFVRERKQNPTSRKFLPRLFGFLFTFLI